jgi:hypothetical protein
VIQFKILKLIFNKKENWAFVPIILILLILISYSLFWFISATPDDPQLSAYSDDWNDISMFYDSLKNEYNVSTIISSPLILNKIDRPENKLYIVLGVEKGYSYDEGLAVLNFLINGGSVIIADDFGAGNSIADILCDNYEDRFEDDATLHDQYLEIEFYNDRLFDSSYIRNTKFVKVNADLGMNRNYEVLLNEPTALHSEGYYNSISRSSSDSWLDENKNGIRDVTEIKESYDIIVLAKYGEGEVCFISDPGIFINNLWKMYDNAVFANDLVQQLLSNNNGNDYEIIFDESQHISQSSDENLRHSMYNFGLQITSGVTGIIFITILLAFLSIFGALKIKPLKKFENRNSLTSRALNFSKYPYITHSDIHWLKKVFLDKVQNAYSYDTDEFFKLPPEIVFNLINNKELYDFFTYYINYPLMVNINYLYHIITLIDQWQPTEPSKNFDDRDGFSGMDQYINNENNIIEFELLENPGPEPSTVYEETDTELKPRIWRMDQNVD